MIMKRHILAAILLIGAVAYSCTSIEEPLPASQDGLATAIIEDFILDGPDTKTVVHFNGDNNPSFTFTATDILGVFPTSPEEGDQQRFDVKTIDGTTATFNGNGFALKEGQKYAAYYPAVMPAPDKENIPLDYTGQVQPGKESFGIAKADYLVAKGIEPSDGVCTFSMQHLGALVVMDVTFPDAGTFTELSLTAAGGTFTTAATLDLKAPSGFSGVTADASAATVTLALGENGAGITVKRKETVRFCLMVAPKDLSAATLTLKLKDSGNNEISMDVAGKDFTKGKAYKYTCAFTPGPLTAPTNLSAAGTANTYIVDVDDVNALGYYFDATKAGNGESFTNSYYSNCGITTGYPASGDISGAGVKAIWIENNCISDLAYDATNNTITFKASGSKGNAKVTLTTGADGTGDGVWTWLIWCTDVPQTVAYHNSTTGFDFTVLDRNIGAITGGPSTDIHAQVGMYYQFGRPTPFLKSETVVVSSIGTMSDALALHPDTFYSNGDLFWFNIWVGGGNYARQWLGFLWGGWSNGLWVNDYINRPINQIPKTKYDPCPVGYQVAPYTLFNGLALGGCPDDLGRYVAGTNDKLFIPCNGFVYNDQYLWSSQDEPNYYISLWTLNHNNSNVAYVWLGGQGGKPGIEEHNPGRAASVRCVAEN